VINRWAQQITSGSLIYKRKPVPSIERNGKKINELLKDTRPLRHITPGDLMLACLV
jgi:hypothetical protein